MKSYIFFGVPGSGKGTQSNLLKDRFVEDGVSNVRVEIGALLRGQAATDTAVGRQMAQVLDKGLLVPSALPISLASTCILENLERVECFIFDGTGRKCIEAKSLVELLLFFPKMDVHAIILSVSQDEASNRLRKRGRSDDVDETIQKRFELFLDTKEGTSASIEFIKNHPDVLTHVVDGVGSEEEVFERILQEISYARS